MLFRLDSTWKGEVCIAYNFTSYFSAFFNTESILKPWILRPLLRLLEDKVDTSQDRYFQGKIQLSKTRIYISSSSGIRTRSSNTKIISALDSGTTMTRSILFIY
jgi:hypothetical protein